MLQIYLACKQVGKKLTENQKKRGMLHTHISTCIVDETGELFVWFWSAYSTGRRTQCPSLCIQIAAVHSCQSYIHASDSDEYIFWRKHLSFLIHFWSVNHLYLNNTSSNSPTFTHFCTSFPYFWSENSLFMDTVSQIFIPLIDFMGHLCIRRTIFWLKLLD